VALDIRAVKAAYPALADGVAYLDGAAGTQVPRTVIDAIASAYASGLGNLGGAFPASARSEAIVAACREAVADLVGGTPEGVVLGPNMTTLTYRMALALGATWEPGDEVVVSRLDHDANVRPWVQAAERARATVRWAEVDTATGTLPVEQYGALVGKRTRLVAVTAASNLIGTRPEVRAIAERAHEVGALVYVDGVHWTPHGPVDIDELGADLYVTSAYKWSGPHVGCLVADPALLARIHPPKLLPSPEEVPWRFEWGTPSFADYAGVVAAVDHLASLDPEAAAGATSRRERLLASMASLEAHESKLFASLISALHAMEHVTTYGRAPRRAPTAFFNVDGWSADEVVTHLARRGVNAWSGDNYACELVAALGLGERGGAVRAGVVHYNDEADVARLIDAVAELA
jgi:cysteine desulfurase family protein (TIGR01976 family)